MRAFIAFELPLALRQELSMVSRSLRQQLSGLSASWVHPDNLHLTLKFLGEIAPAQVAAIAATLQPLAAAYAPIALELSRLGVFPNLTRPRVLWAGLQAPPALAQLAAELERALLPLGFAAEERSFVPHLTLARLRPGATAAALEALLAAQRVQPATASLYALGLFESQLKPSGAVYNLLVRARLGAQ